MSHFSQTRDLYLRPRLELLESRTLLDANPLPALAGAAAPASGYDASTILVQFREGASPHSLPGTQLASGFDLVPNLYQIRLNSGVSVADALAAYEADPGVAYATPNHGVSTSWVPNDPQFSSQWDMRNTGQLGGKAGADIKAADAWGVTVGGRATKVAVFDTGIDYTHPDLYLNVWLNQGEIPASRRANLLDVDRDGQITFRDLNDSRNKGAGKITDLNGNGYVDGGDLLRPMIKDASGKDTGNGGWANGVSEDRDRYVDDLVGWNFYANNNNPMDDYGHGTHVAGTIGAVGNNGVGVAGINWQVQMASIRFTDNNGYGSLTGIIAGLDYVVAKGFRISNHSWGVSSSVTSLFDAMKRSRDRGLVIVASAGNAGRNTDTSPSYPSGYDLDNIVSVGATTRYDTLASFSNYGTKSVDVAAPGDSILSTNRNRSYGLRSGTSMAAPHVTGVIALVWTLRPEWNYRQVIQQVLATADRLPSLDGKVGYGRLNALAAVRVPPRTSTNSLELASVTEVTTTAEGTTSEAATSPVNLLAAPTAAVPVVPGGEAPPGQADAPPASRAVVLDELFAGLAGLLASQKKDAETAQLLWAKRPRKEGGLLDDGGF